MASKHFSKKITCPELAEIKKDTCESRVEAIGILQFLHNHTVVIGTSDEHGLGIRIHIGDIGIESPREIGIIGRQCDLRSDGGMAHKTMLKRPGIRRRGVVNRMTIPQQLRISIKIKKDI